MKARLLVIFLTVSAALSAHGQTAGPSLPAPTADVAAICSQLISTQPEIARAFLSDPKLKECLLKLFTQVSVLQQKKKTRQQILRDRIVQGLMVEIGGRLEDQSALAPALTAIADEASRRGLVPKEQVSAVLPIAIHAIRGELFARGATLASKGNAYESWMQIYRRVGGDIRKKISTLKAKHTDATKALVEAPEFSRLLESETHSVFHYGGSLEILADGKKSFDLRSQAIASAKESIDVMTWAFYDDSIGERFAKELIAAQARGIKVRVIVDGQVAYNPKHAKWVKAMEENGIETRFWMSADPKKPFSGQHRKGMLIDGKSFIGGGRNFGDLYVDWRDTDVAISGGAVKDFQSVFQALIDGKIPRLGGGAKTKQNNAAEFPKIALVDHHPGHGENILRSNLAVIEAAQKSIDIENAYFILDPATYAALLRAKSRGVKIRVFTNSPQSVDEPIVSMPILRSVNRLVSEGIDVYVKTGTTLHSKFLIVDGAFASIGSYNFHPRSYRYEGEMIFNAIDPKIASQFEALFNIDLKNEAVQVTAPIAAPPNLGADVGEILFYDQL